MAETVAFKYRAFISYSHADTSWAKWLHRGLESFRIDKDLVGRETPTGTIPQSLRPIFRDRDDFTAGHTLSDQTLAALDASQALIVICSPASAKSDYVTEEIRLFKSRHPERPVIPLIVDGTPGDPELECFPSSLKFRLDDDGQITNEPLEVLAADAREAGDGKHLALAKVVAGLLGVSSDDIFRRAERERRRKGRVRNGIVATILLLCAGGGYAFWDSLQKGETIVQQQREKSEALKIASELLGANPAAAAAPGQEQSLVAALIAIQENAAKGDEDYAKAFKLLKAGKGAEAVPLLLAAAEAKKARAAKENKEAAKAYREAAAIAAVAEPWRARELYAEAARLDPDDIVGMFQNAWFQQEAGALTDAEAAYRRVLVAGKPGKDDRALYWARLGIGDIRVARGDLSAAKADYRLAGEIAARLAEADPGNAGWQRDLSVSYERVGDVLVAQGDLAAALKAYRDGLAIAERLAEADPSNAGWQRDLSVSHIKVGDVLVAQGDLAAALKAYEDSLTIAERLAEADPNNAGWQRDLSYSYGKAGNVLVAQGDLAAALKAYEDSLAIGERLADADPSNAGWQRDLSVSYEKIGNVLVAQGDLAAALKAYEDSLAIAERLAAADPGNAGWQRDLSVSYNKVGDVLRAQGDLAAALKAYEDSLAIRERLAEADPGNAGWQRDLALGYGRVAMVLAQQGKAAQALSQYRQTREIIARLVELSPDDATLPNDLAWYDAEIAKLEQAQATEPGTEQPEQAATAGL